MQGRLRWQDLLLSRLTERTKLVGPTISCESSPKNGDVNGEWRTNPHVQSVFAMDKVKAPPPPPPPPLPCCGLCQDHSFDAALLVGGGLVAARLTSSDLQLRRASVQSGIVSVWTGTIR